MISSSPLPNSPDSLLWRELVPGGNHWSGPIRRGTLLRLTDQNGGANVSLSLINREEHSERLNIPDTLKGQHTAFITRGNVLYSDMGRVMASVIEDSAGWIDALCGPSDDADIHARYGTQSFADVRNAMFRSARGGLLIELGKWNLGARDLGMTLNLFSKVSVEEGGHLHFAPNHSRSGSTVSLRFEMDCLLFLSTAPHRLDPKPIYAPADVTLECALSLPVPPDDECRISCSQNERAFGNTARYYAGALGATPIFRP